MRIIGLMLVSLTLVSASDPRKVVSEYEKGADFGAYRTYSWTVGADAFDAGAALLIVAAMDAEMAALGFTKVATGADVTLAYYVVTSTYVDLKAKPKLRRWGGGPAKTHGRSTLRVVMRKSQPSLQLWKASTREYLDPDPAKLGGTIRDVVARLFETYPARRARDD